VSTEGEPKKAAPKWAHWLVLAVLVGVPGAVCASVVNSPDEQPRAARTPRPTTPAAPAPAPAPSGSVDNHIYRECIKIKSRAIREAYDISQSNAETAVHSECMTIARDPKWQRSAR
jgi:hypothetical protein